MSTLPVLKPGDTVGILGGGQLGRMLALAAAELGLNCHIYAPEKNSCAFDVVRDKTCAPYEDEAALARFAKPVLVVNGEFDTPNRRRAGEALAGALPLAERVVIAGAGHLPNLDAPRAYNEALQAFLRRQARAAA